MQTFNVYISKTKFNNLPQECAVLIHVFFPEYSVELVNKDNRSNISIEVDGDSFYITHDNITCLKYLIQDTFDLRYQIKVKLFEYLVKLTGYYPPWGILQGIRPTKLVYKIKNQYAIKESMDAQYTSIFDCLTKKYKLSQKMAHLALKVASYEEAYIEQSLDEEPPIASIYVSIPYCPSRCLYCSFPSNDIEKYEQTHQKYLSALKKELTQVLPFICGKYKVSALYIGGGTPTTLSAEALDELLNEIHQIVPLERFKEITVEAGRPDTITKTKLDVLKRWGVHRISINPQTMNQETLELIGRRHTVEAIKDAFYLAKEVGIERINMDLILGLPNEQIAHVEKTFEAIRNLMPTEITVHTLAIKKSSRLKENQRNYNLASRNQMEKILDYSREFLIHQMHMQPYYLYRQKNMVASYENIGYTSQEPCLYNMQIIEEAISIFAFGAGATTKLRHPKGNIERIENVKNVDIYIERIDAMIERKQRHFTENKK